MVFAFPYRFFTESKSASMEPVISRQVTISLMMDDLFIIRRQTPGNLGYWISDETR